MCNNYPVSKKKKKQKKKKPSLFLLYSHCHHTHTSDTQDVAFSPIMQFSASLVAQLVKNPPAMQETLVQFLGWEDPLEKGTATHSSILP